MSPWYSNDKAVYRYRWSLNPVEDQYADMMDVTFEILNKDTRAGWWQIDIIKCESGLYSVFSNFPVCTMSLSSFLIQ